MNMRRIAVTLLVVLVSTMAGFQTTGAAMVTTLTGLIDSTHYKIEVPSDWNGTLVLYSHGYQRPDQPLPGPLDVRDPLTGEWLLDHGYALAGSDFGATGWAVSNGIQNQIALLDEFAAAFGAPQRTIAWGSSLGGLISAALVELYPDRFTAALPMCEGAASSVGLWNQSLDSAFAFKTLLASNSALRVVGISFANATGNFALAQQIAATAQSTPEGRARLALAAALNDVPGWYDPTSPEPSAQDYAAQEQNQYLWEQQVDLPFQFAFRADLELRAGGNPSWNTDVDYRVQLSHSVDLPEVIALYHQAGLDLNADLQTLNNASRIAADPAAAGYLQQYVTLDGRLGAPVLSLHTTGDGLAPVQGERDYAQVVAHAGSASYLRQTYIHRAGHCTFTPAETIAAFQTLVNRVDTGHWGGTSADTLNQMAQALGSQYNVFAAGSNQVPTPSAFINYQPSMYLRPYDASSSPVSTTGQ